VAAKRKWQMAGESVAWRKSETIMKAISNNERKHHARRNNRNENQRNKQWHQYENNQRKWRGNGVMAYLKKWQWRRRRRGESQQRQRHHQQRHRINSETDWRDGGIGSEMKVMAAKISNNENENRRKAASKAAAWPASKSVKKMAYGNQTRHHARQQLCIRKSAAKAAKWRIEMAKKWRKLKGESY
jgi:hypothetical protein